MFTLIIEDKYGAIVDEYSFEDGEFVIGRSQSCDIVLAADNVSRRHGRLYTVEGRCYIEDLKAANGIWLNGKRIYNVTELPRSAQIRIGDFFLHIEGAAFSRPLGASVFAHITPIHGGVAEPFELNRPTTLVGRGKDCTAVINDPSVSRIHAKFTHDPSGRVVLEDLRSSNGTFVNERRIDVQDLQHGDRVRFGTMGFIFQIQGESWVDPNEAGPPAPQNYPPPGHPPSPAPSFRPSPPISSYGDDYPPYYEGAGQQPYVRPERSLLPQVAAAAIIVLAFMGLVILVGFAFDHWVAPAISAHKQSSEASKQAKDSEKRLAERRVAKRKKLEKLETLLARGQEAVAKKRWEEAEKLYKQARRIDPIQSDSTKALSRIDREKRAKARFQEAEMAFKNKKYDDAISYNKMVPDESVYHADAAAALKAITQILEIDGDAACAARKYKTCKKKYQAALKTGFASLKLEKKYAHLLRRRR